MTERNTVVLFDSGRLSEAVNDARAISELAGYPPHTYEANQLGPVRLALENSPLAFITALNAEDLDHPEFSSAGRVVHLALSLGVASLVLCNDRRAGRFCALPAEGDDDPATEARTAMILPIVGFYDQELRVPAWLGGIAERAAQA